MLVEDKDELRMRKGNKGTVANRPESVLRSACAPTALTRAFRRCTYHDIVLNFFVARTARVQQVRWDRELKLGEHQVRGRVEARG